MNNVCRQVFHITAALAPIFATMVVVANCSGSSSQIQSSSKKQTKAKPKKAACDTDYRRTPSGSCVPACEYLTYWNGSSCASMEEYWKACEPKSDSNLQSRELESLCSYGWAHCCLLAASYYSSDSAWVDSRNRRLRPLDADKERYYEKKGKQIFVEGCYEKNIGRACVGLSEYLIGHEREKALRKGCEIDEPFACSTLALDLYNGLKSKKMRKNRAEALRIAKVLCAKKQKHYSKQCKLWHKAVKEIESLSRMKRSFPPPPPPVPLRRTAPSRPRTREHDSPYDLPPRGYDVPVDSEPPSYDVPPPPKKSIR